MDNKARMHGYATQIIKLLLVRVRALVRSPLYRNAYALVGSTAATSGLGLIFWVLAARYYTPEIVGLNAATISMLMFLGSIAQIGLTSAMMRFVPTAGAKTGRLVGMAYGVCVGIATTISLVFVLGVHIWWPSLRFLRDNPAIGAWFVFSCAMWCLFLVQDGVLTGLRQAVWVTLENTLYAAIKLGVLVVFAFVLREQGVFMAWTVPLAAIIIWVNVVIFRRLIPQHIHATAGQVRSVEGGKITKYVAAHILSLLFAQTFARLLPVVIIAQVGESTGAFFFLPWTITTSLRLVSANMVNSFVVEGAHDNTHLVASGYHFFKHIVQVVVPGVGVVMLVAPYMLQTLGNSYAVEGTALFRLLVLAAIPNLVTTMYIGIARVQQHVAVITVIQGAFCVLGLGLSYLLLPMYGITGVGLAILLSDTLVASAVVLSKMRLILQLLSPQRRSSF